ncbi:MAG: ABC transporter permease [Bacteroidales bacterium]|nr:MAG: ABC transporter permease [Bacteroidales bacterium]
MLISWIKQFIRVSVKGKFYTIVNTLGLSIGLMCTIIILLWADFQKGFDKFQPEYKKIFQVYEIQSYAGGYKLYTYSTPGPLAPFLNSKIPQINSSTRYTHGSAVIGMGDNAFRENGVAFTDSMFFKIFKVDFIAGSGKECLKDLNSIVLTETTAKKIFGSTDAIGRSVRLDGKSELKVTAIVKDYPKNSNISFNCLIPFEKILDFGFRSIDHWGNNSFSTYVKLNSTSEIDTLEKRIQTEVVKMGTSESTTFHLYPIEKVRLYDIDPNGFGMITFISILLSVAGFVLILASINFINLITARAANRAKEVGVRKVIGSSRAQLITQYFMESFLSTILALFIAILLVDLALPTFNLTLKTELHLNFSNYFFWSKIVLVTIIVGFVSGIYPAFVLSSFHPANVLKGILRTGAKGAGFRKAMVIIQYTITIFLVIVSFFMFKQISFISNADTGMSRKNVISIPFRRDMQANYKSFKNEIKKIPNIKYVTSVEHIPFQIYSSTSDFYWSGRDTTQSYLFSFTGADEYLTDAMEIKMVEGRFYSSEFATDTSCIVINETAAKIMDKKQTLGEVIDLWNMKLKVIGVMKDFHFEHFSGKIQPLFIYYTPNAERANNILIKANGEFDLQTMNQIKRAYADFYPEYPFESTVLEDDYHRMFAEDRQIKTILSQFTLFAILISCIGLLSLAAYIAEQQRKSLVLRKIHGASMFRILLILLGNFTKWVLISGIIAIPLAYLTITSMFKNYAYHTDLSWWIFVGALVSALFLASITVLYQAVKTARIKPVDALRCE